MQSKKKCTWKKSFLVFLARVVIMIWFKPNPLGCICMNWTFHPLHDLKLWEEKTSSPYVSQMWSLCLAPGHGPSLWSRLQVWKDFDWLVNRGREGAPCQALNLPRCIQGDSWTPCPWGSTREGGFEFLLWLAKFTASPTGCRQFQFKHFTDFRVSSGEVRNSVSGFDSYFAFLVQPQHLWSHSRLIR